MIRFLYPRGTDSEAWFITSKRPVSAVGATTVLLDDYVTRQLIVDILLPKLRADGRFTGASSPISLLAHGYVVSLIMGLYKSHNAVSIAVYITLPQLVKGGVGHPAWCLKCSVSRQVPGGAPGTYTRVWGSGPAGISAQCSFIYSHRQDLALRPGCVEGGGQPVLTWMDTAMHDMGSLGHTLQTFHETGRT